MNYRVRGKGAFFNTLYTYYFIKTDSPEDVYQYAGCINEKSEFRKLGWFSKVTELADNRARR